MYCGERGWRVYGRGLQALPIVLLVALLCSSCVRSAGGQSSLGSGTEAGNGNGATTLAKLNTGLSSAVYNATNMGTVPDDQVVRVELTFKLNPQAYQKFSTTDWAQANSIQSSSELADQVGLTRQLYQRIAAYFRGPAVRVTPGVLRTNIRIDAPARVINSLFHTTLTLYQAGNPEDESGQQYYAPDRAQPATLPAFITSTLLAVTGLDSYTPMPAHHASLSPLTPAQTAHVSGTQQRQSANCVNYRTDLLLPAQLGKAYQYDQLWEQGYRGQGMHVNLVSFDNYSQADLDNYFSCVAYTGHMSTSVYPSVNAASDTSSSAGGSGSDPNSGDSNSSSPVSTSGNSGTVPGRPATSATVSGTGSTQQDDETTADVEAIAGLVPQSNIHLYMYDHQTKSAFDDYATIYTEMLQQIIEDNLGQRDRAGDVVSLSWGNAESMQNPAFMQAFNQRLWLLTNLLHMTVFAASGDCGAFDGSVYNQLAVDFPASSPWSVAVGGTRLTLDQQGERLREEVWSDGANTDSCRNRWGSGGGISSVFAQQPWQHVVGMSNQSSHPMRQLPDLSAVAYNIPIYYGGRWTMAAGTSLSAPIWAAGMLLLNQGLLARRGLYYYGPQFFYRLANSAESTALFHDIIEGSNLHYAAAPGWDLASGAGSPQLGTIFRRLW